MINVIFSTSLHLMKIRLLERATFSSSLWVEVFNGAGWDRSGQNLNGLGRDGSCQMLNGAKVGQSLFISDPLWPVLKKVHKIVFF